MAVRHLFIIAALVNRLVTCSLEARYSARQIANMSNIEFGGHRDSRVRWKVSLHYALLFVFNAGASFLVVGIATVDASHLEVSDGRLEELLAIVLLLLWLLLLPADFLERHVALQFRGQGVPWHFLLAARCSIGLVIFLRNHFILVVVVLVEPLVGNVVVCRRVAHHAVHRGVTGPVLAPLHLVNSLLHGSLFLVKVAALVPDDLAHQP